MCNISNAIDDLYNIWKVRMYHIHRAMRCIKKLKMFLFYVFKYAYIDVEIKTSVLLIKKVQQDVITRNLFVNEKIHGSQNKYTTHPNHHCKKKLNICHHNVFDISSYRYYRRTVFSIFSLFYSTRSTLTSRCAVLSVLW